LGSITYHACDLAWVSACITIVFPFWVRMIKYMFIAVARGIWVSRENIELLRTRLTWESQYIHNI
jgi:hypothetical protein